jgi:hypothetical protein
MLRKWRPSPYLAATKIHSSMPPCAGLRAHVELSRISGFIVCETFKISPRSYKSGQSTNNIDHALKLLYTWQAQLPSSLKIPEDLSHSDPSCCILHMAYNQLILLTTRPIFFAAVKQAVAQRIVRSQSPTEQYSQEHRIRACSAAAHRNLLMAQRIVQSSRKLLQAGLHFVFNAAVILLLNRIMNCVRQSEAEHSEGDDISRTSLVDQYEPSIRFAVHSFEEEARTGTNYPRDCCRVLHDLRALTDRYSLSQIHAKRHQESIVDHVHLGSQSGHGDNCSVEHNPIQQLLDGNDGIYEEMISWAQNDGLQLHNSLFI